MRTKAPTFSRAPQFLKSVSGRRTSRSVPKKPLSARPDTAPRRSKSPSNPSERVSTIVKSLQATVNSLPITIKRINILNEHLNSAKVIASSASRCLARSSASFWQRWASFSSDAATFTADLTPARSLSVCEKQLGKFSQNIATLEQYRPPDSPTFSVGIEGLKQTLSDLRHATVEAFAREDEQKVVTAVRALVKPYSQLLESITKEYAETFHESIMTVPESTALRAGCVHIVELILQSLRGLRESVELRKKIQKEIAEAESELTAIFPPNQKRPFQPTSQVRRLKGEIKRTNDSIRELKRELKQTQERDGKEVEELKKEIEDIQNEMGNSNASDLKKTCDELTAERNDLLERTQRASQRLKVLREEESKRAPPNPNEDIQALVQESQRLREQLSYLRGEQRKMEEEMVKARAMNSVLAKNAKNEAEFAENVKQRAEKMELLAKIQQVREDLLAMRTFRAKALHLNIIPVQGDVTKQQLVLEYQTAMANNEAIKRQRTAVLESVSSLKKRRDQLLFDSVVSDMEVSSANMDKLEKSLIEELEKATAEFGEEKKKCLREQQKLQNDQATARLLQTDAQIMAIRQAAINAAKAAKKAKAQRSDVASENVEEAQQEIAILNQEIKDNEAANAEMLLWIAQMQDEIVEAKARTAAAQQQISIFNAKIKNPRADVQATINAEIDRACEENKRLRLQLDDAMMQLKELDRMLGNTTADDATLEERFQSIERQLTILVSKNERS